MDPVRLLILTAVQPEARALVRAFSLRRDSENAVELPIWRKNDVALSVIGVGAGGLSGVAKRVGSFDAVIMAGVAGALSPTLSVGDVVVDTRGKAGGWLPGLEGTVAGRLHTSQRLVTSAAAKASLLTSSDCLAVDMETELVADFALARGAAFVAVRGISDSADEPLDPALLTLVDAEGRPRIGQAIAMLVRHPSQLPAMLRLARATKLAMNSVARTVGKIVASRWPHAPA
jgi:hypothetical protein